MTADKLTRHAELVLDARNLTGESPVWRSAEQSLYWVDIPAKKLFALNTQVHATSQWEAPEMLACIAPTDRADRWLAGAQSGIFVIHTAAPGSLKAELLVPVHHAMQGMRFNDGRCDRQGRFLAGTMQMNMSQAANVGAIYQLQGDGTKPSLKKLLDGLITPNGMAFSPDGRTMYLSDSHPSRRQVWAYDYDTDTGTPTHPRPFMDMRDFAGRPDGAAMDVDGCYWICGNDAGLVHRYTPQGQLDFSISVPVDKPAMCAFGGTDLHTLYITSIRPNTAAPKALDGGLFAVQLSDVQGLPEPSSTFF